MPESGGLQAFAKVAEQELLLSTMLSLTHRFCTSFLILHGVQMTQGMTLQYYRTLQLMLHSEGAPLQSRATKKQHDHAAATRSKADPAMSSFYWVNHDRALLQVQLKNHPPLTLAEEN